MRAFRRKVALVPVPPPGFLQSHVCVFYGIGRVVNRCRSLYPEPVAVASPLGAEERLCSFFVVKDFIPQVGVFCTESQVPQVLSRRKGLALPGSLLRSVLNAGGVRTGYALVSAFLLQSGVWLLRCLDVWLMFLLFLEDSCWTRDKS